MIITCYPKLDASLFFCGVVYWIGRQPTWDKSRLPSPGHQTRLIVFLVQNFIPSGDWLHAVEPCGARASPKTWKKSSPGRNFGKLLGLMSSCNSCNPQPLSAIGQWVAAIGQLPPADQPREVARGIPWIWSEHLIKVQAGIVLLALHWVRQELIRFLDLDEILFHLKPDHLSTSIISLEFFKKNRNQNRNLSKQWESKI